MNNLKKLGLTALAGSLVAVSAQAGELTASGAANFTYKTTSGSFGKGIASDKGITFAGSGELDNGWSVAISTYMTDDFGLSSSSTSLTMGSMGTVKVGTKYGSVAAGYDEETPQAYEQLSDHQNNAANYVGSWMDNGSVMLALPALDIGPGSLAISVGLAPDAMDNMVHNGAVGANEAQTHGQGMDIGATLTTDAGLTLGLYGGTREYTKQMGTLNDAGRDQFDGSVFVKYTTGPVSFGYQQTYVDSGMPGTAATAATSAKTIGTATGIFEDTQYSVSFNVNDNLSISYSNGDSTYDDQSNVAGGTEIVDVEQSQDAIQIAYSMGGLSISAYQMNTENPGYDSNAAEVNATEISIGMAF